jgi:hypothetical protein
MTTFAIAYDLLQGLLKKKIGFWGALIAAVGVTGAVTGITWRVKKYWEKWHVQA